MQLSVKHGATLLAVAFTIGAVLALGAERLVLGGTLLLFTAFSIYLRETHS